MEPYAEGTRVITRVVITDADFDITYVNEADRGRPIPEGSMGTVIQVYLIYNREPMYWVEFTRPFACCVELDHEDAESGDELAARMLPLDPDSPRSLRTANSE
jgi:hypothetical protein